MRLVATALLLCFPFASAWADEPADAEPDTASRPPEFSEWESLDKVLETLGKPSKRRTDDKGGTILTYKFPVNSGLKLVTGELHLVGGAISNGPSSEEGTWELRLPSGGIGPEARGKVKARFYFDADGHVYAVEVDRVKWKGRP